MVSCAGSLSTNHKLPTHNVLSRSFAKGQNAKNDKVGMKKKKKDGKKTKKSDFVADGDEESPLDMMELQTKMDKSISYLTEQLDVIRIGRASPELLEDLQIDAYGEKQPLKNVGQVSVKSATLLIVTVMDPQLIDTVETAIKTASTLELHPFRQNDTIHVPLPKPTEEVRQQFLKKSKNKCEEVRTTIKRIRQDSLQKLKKKKGKSEDLIKNCQEQLQELCDDANSEIDALLKNKEAELKTD